MKKNENKTARRMQTIAICSCLCLVALGAGVIDRSHLEETEQTAEEMPVTSVKSPAVEIAALERSQRSNDPGEAPEVETPAKPQTAKPTFAYPLQGEVVLPYSIDHAIYDPTLEQYRTNASVSISAETGAEVKAAADGTVQEIRESAEAGNIITIAHQDGWMTTYGQLKDTVAVKEGDRVTQGQTIGSVDDPTKYGVALGSHLEFSMEQNGEPKNPAEHLEKNG